MFHSSRISAHTGTYHRTLTAPLLSHATCLLGAMAGAMRPSDRVWVL